MTWHDIRDEHKKLHPAVRVGGYLKANADLCAYGAKLRTEHDKDEEWTDKENAEWDRLGDEIDPWFHALTDYERSMLLRSGVEDVFGRIARGEDPVEHLPKGMTKVILEGNDEGNDRDGSKYFATAVSEDMASLLREAFVAEAKRRNISVQKAFGEFLELHRGHFERMVSVAEKDKK